MYSNIHGWILYTPLFQQFTVSERRRQQAFWPPASTAFTTCDALTCAAPQILVDSPIALLIALWGMSGINILEGLSNSDVLDD